MHQWLHKIARSLTTLAMIGTVILPNTVVAADSLNISGSNPVRVTTSGLDSGQAVVSTLLRVVTSVAVILFVILLVVGGVQYLGSFGNEESTTKAKKLIIDAVVGLFIVLAAFGISSFIFGQLGVTGLGGFGITR